MAHVFIGIDSKIEPAENINRALEALAACCTAIEQSPHYQSPGVDGAAGVFVNLVVKAQTHLAPEDLVAALKEIEQTCGRSASSHTIDLDLLLYDKLILNTDTVSVPRDDIERYAFVLKPLADLAPTEKHPVLALTYQEMWERAELDASHLSLID